MASLSQSTVLPTSAQISQSPALIGTVLKASWSSGTWITSTWSATGISSASRNQRLRKKWRERCATRARVEDVEELEEDQGGEAQRARVGHVTGAGEQPARQGQSITPRVPMAMSYAHEDDVLDPWGGQHAAPRVTGRPARIHAVVGQLDTEAGAGAESVSRLIQRIWVASSSSTSVPPASGTKAEEAGQGYAQEHHQHLADVGGEQVAQELLVLAKMLRPSSTAATTSRRSCRR